MSSAPAFSCRGEDLGFRLAVPTHFSAHDALSGRTWPQPLCCLSFLAGDDSELDLDLGLARK